MELLGPEILAGDKGPEPVNDIFTVLAALVVLLAALDVAVGQVRVAIRAEELGAPHLTAAPPPRLSIMPRMVI